MKIFLLEGFDATVREHMNLEVALVLEHFAATIASRGPDDVFVVNFLHVTLESRPRAEKLQAHFALKFSQNLRHVCKNPDEFLLVSPIKFVSFTSSQSKLRDGEKNVRMLWH